MERPVINAKLREKTGSRHCRKLREQGDIPAVLYGHGIAPQNLTIHEHDLELALQHGERVIELSVEGKNENALIKDVQHDTFGQIILHTDLARVDLDERVQVVVPVILTGTPVGVQEGGVLMQVLSEVTIEVPVRSIPEEIRQKVSDLGINDQKHVGDLSLPEGATLIDDPEDVLCTVSVVAEEPEEEEVQDAEALATEPELIGREEEDEEEGDADKEE